MKTNKGEKVIAIRDAKAGVVYAFGYGTYVGDHIPPDNIGFGVPNPKIVLDNGRGTVWGRECWWGPVDGFKAKYKGWKIVQVPLPDRGEIPLEPAEVL